VCDLVGSVSAVGWHYDGTEPKCSSVSRYKFHRTRCTQKHSITKFDTNVRQSPSYDFRPIEQIASTNPT
jgi:hypothetical protein